MGIGLFLGLFLCPAAKTALRADALRSSPVIFITPREPAQPPGFANIHYYVPPRIEER